jgi:WD40 repeat protein
MRYRASRGYLLSASVIVLCFVLGTRSGYAQTELYTVILSFGPDPSLGRFYYFNSLAFSPDDKYIAVGTDDWPGIEIRELKTGMVVKTLSTAPETGKSVDDGPFPQWSSDGQYIVGVSIEQGGTVVLSSGTVHVWNVNTGQRTVIPNREDKHSYYARENGIIPDVYAAWRPDRKNLLIADNEGKLRLLDFPSGAIRWIIAPYQDLPLGYRDMSLSIPCEPKWNNDGNRFVCIGDTVNAVFDGNTGEQLFDLADEEAIGAYPQWSSDGRYILNVDMGDGGQTDEIEVWDASNGHKLELPKQYGVPFALSPDSSRLAVVNGGLRSLNITDFQTGEILMGLPGYYGLTPVWSRDGTYFAFIDPDVKVHIFVDNSKPF